jgi:hypothetical protein
MKIKFLVLIVSISLVFISCITIGNGTIITEERNLASFENIEVSGNTEVRFHTSDEYRVIVTTDSNLIEYYETIIRNNVLKIRPKPIRSYSFTKQVVDVYCPTITGISISGSGSFEAIDKIITSSFKMNISGSGNVDGTIECNNFSAHISGNGNIHIVGNSEDAEIGISGSGSFNGIEFKVNNCSVDISGSGEIDIFVENNLNAKNSGSGTIKYRGNPRFDFRSSGSGRIVKVE